MSRLMVTLVAIFLMAPTCDDNPEPTALHELQTQPTREPEAIATEPQLEEENELKTERPPAKPVDPQRSAKLPDKGIWPDLDARVWLSAPLRIDPQTTTILVDKQRRVLTLLADGVPVISYSIALGFAPQGDKVERGDGRTPEGNYYICELRDRQLAEKYGARSMRLSYPNAMDAAHGAATNKISNVERRAIEQAIAARKMPPQNTRLGSSIRIHGGGITSDWTAGCVALRDDDVIDLYGLVRNGTEVRVLGDGEQLPFGDRDGDGIPDPVDLLLGARKTVLNGSEYDGKYVKITHRGGDVPREIGVCTDVIVRALRNAGLDLQEDLQEDRNRRPKAYPRMQQPNPSIDPRRVKNLSPWFAHHWKSRPVDVFEDYRPADVILMNTLPADGPDHIGIISDRLGRSGKPLVINNWTVGHTTAEMNLLDWVEVTHRYRWPPP